VLPWWGFSLIVAGITALLAVAYKLVNSSEDKKTEKDGERKDNPEKEKGQERNASEKNQEEGKKKDKSEDQKNNTPPKKEDLNEQNDKSKTPLDPKNFLPPAAENPNKTKQSTPLALGNSRKKSKAGENNNLPSPEYKKATTKTIDSNPPNKNLKTLKNNNKFRSF
jgi:hypothetical protein